MKAKIGRNSPCPCGSGKKYKNCCESLADVIEFNADPWVKSNQVMSALKLKLEENYKAATKKLRQDARQRFFRLIPGDTVPPDHEAIFSDWLWFDLEINGCSMGVDYLKQHGDFLAPIMKQSLIALNQSYLSVYQVIQNQGRLLAIKDLFSDENIHILLKEPWEVPDSDSVSILLMGRVVKITDNQIFSGMVLFMNAAEEQEKFLSDHVKHWQSITDKNFPELFKAHGEILLGIFDHAYQKCPIKLQELYCTYLHDQERETLKAGLDSDPDYSYAYHTEGFDWYEPRQLHGDYARIAIGKELALCTAEILNDIDSLAAKLTSHLLVTRLIHSMLVPEMLAVNEAPYWFLVLKDKETERWLSTPQEGLNNQTPRQLLLEDNGKERILAYLDSLLENAAKNELEDMQEILNYIQTRVRIS